MFFFVVCFSFVFNVFFFCFGSTRDTYVIVRVVFDSCFLLIVVVNFLCVCEFNVVGLNVIFVVNCCCVFINFCFCMYKNEFVFVIVRSSYCRYSSLMIKCVVLLFYCM